MKERVSSSDTNPDGSDSDSRLYYERVYMTLYADARANALRDKEEFVELSVAMWVQNGLCGTQTLNHGKQMPRSPLMKGCPPPNYPTQYNVVIFPE